MQIYTLFLIIVGILCYAVFPMCLLFIRKRKTQKIFCLVILVSFIFVLLIGVLGKIDITKQYVKIYLDFSGDFASKPINLSFAHLTTLDMFINIVMLIPIGTYFVFFNQNMRFWKMIVFSLLIGLGVGLCIETLQFILPVQRSVQLSDIVFNSLSVMIGALYGFLLVLIRTIIKKK